LHCCEYKGQDSVIDPLEGCRRKMTRLAAEEAKILSMYGVARRARVNEAHAADICSRISWVSSLLFSAQRVSFTHNQDRGSA
jgi:hypothetical protein